MPPSSGYYHSFHAYKTILLHTILRCITFFSSIQAELEAFENRLKGRRKNKRRKDEVEVEPSVWQKYKNMIVLPVCGAAVVMLAWFMAYSD